MRTPIILAKPDMKIQQGRDNTAGSSSRPDSSSVVGIQQRGMNTPDEQAPSSTESQLTSGSRGTHKFARKGSADRVSSHSTSASTENASFTPTPTTHSSTPSSSTPAPAPAAPATQQQPKSHLDQHLASGLAALKINLPEDLHRSTKLIEHNFQWSDTPIEYLLDQTDFVVVGCVGLQGTGKSTIMSMLADSSDIVYKKSYVFEPQDRSEQERAIHLTNGIDMYVTKERLILLDTQPIMSPSMLSQFLLYDRKVPSEFSSAEICLEVQALQLLTFMYTVCSVVLVVQDHFVDLDFLNLLKTAEMLKLNTSSANGQDSAGVTSEDINEHFPYLVFVYNCCEPRSFQHDVIESMCHVTSRMFEHCRIRVRGSASIMRTPLLPFHKSKLLYEFQELNLFILPSFERPNDDEADNPISKYKGHPSFSVLTAALRHQLAGMPREHITHHTLSEKNWFHYAARSWENVKKSSLIAEYHRLLTP